MPVSTETVSLAGSGIVFNNTYNLGVTEPVRAAILNAENYLQAHFTDAVTLNVTFNYESEGPGFIASNAFAVYPVTYAQLVGALGAHATTADDRLAVAGLPTIDPSNGAGFRVPVGEGQALGLIAATGQNDVTVMINSDEPWTFGSDLVGALEHELTEGGFGRVEALGLDPSAQFAPMDLFRFNFFGRHDFSGGRDNQGVVFGVDGGHLSHMFLHDSIGPDGVNDGFDLGDWDFTFEDAFGGGGGGHATSISAVDLQVLDVLGFTPSGAPPGSGPDDFADSFADTAHPFGQIVVGAPVTAALQAIEDLDWFKVQLNAGTDYVINLTGQDGGGGTLDDPILRLHDASGVELTENDDADFTTFDSRLVVHPAASGTFYLEVGSFADVTSGSYTLSVQAGATVSTDGNDVMVAPAAGGTLMAGLGNDTITADADLTAQTYLRGEAGDDVINGGGGFDDANGNMGNDTIHGNGGDDYSVGGKDNDLLFGDDGNDIVWGNLGNDTCDGGDGNDQCRGGQGDDSVSGGAGDDFISGDRGNDTVSGGSGADLFHTFSGAGIDKVLDFNLAEGDRVMLDPGTVFTVKQVGADTVVDMGNGDQMILVGVQMSTLTPGWIFGA